MGCFSKLFIDNMIEARQFKSAGSYSRSDTCTFPQHVQYETNKYKKCIPTGYYVLVSLSPDG